MITHHYTVFTIGFITTVIGISFFIGVVVTVIGMTWWLGKTGHDSCSMQAGPEVKNRLLNDYFNNMIKVAKVIESSNLVVLISGTIFYYFDKNNVHLFILTLYQIAFLLSSIGLIGVFLTRSLSDFSVPTLTIW
jgi:hypothetical protein